MMKKKQKLMLILLVAILLLMAESNLFMIRAFSPKELDDIHPDISCSEKLIKEADIIWVIPKLNGKDISDNKTWCENILKLNKEIGLHGYRHEYLEFANETKESELKKAIDIFEDCFDFKPKLFKSPQLKISHENAELIESYNMTIKGRFNSVAHKVYHCNDTGVFSNQVIKAF